MLDEHAQTILANVSAALTVLGTLGALYLPLLLR